MTTIVAPPWEEQPTEGGIADAPSDGKTYGRKDATLGISGRINFVSATGAITRRVIGFGENAGINAIGAAAGFAIDNITTNINTAATMYVNVGMTSPTSEATAKLMSFTVFVEM